MLWYQINPPLLINDTDKHSGKELSLKMMKRCRQTKQSLKLLKRLGLPYISQSIWVNLYCSPSICNSHFFIAKFNDLDSFHLMQECYQKEEKYQNALRRTTPPL